MKKYLAILVLIQLLFLYGNSMPVDSMPRFTVQQLDSRNGLSNSCADYIFKDSDDLLWIATWDGLNIYDGSSFHVFNYKKDESGHIGSGVIKKIMEDSHKRIWITTNQGFSRYDKKSGRFFNYFYDQNHISKSVEMPLMAIDGEEVYVFGKDGSKDMTVYRYNELKDTFEKAGRLPGEAAYQVLFDDDHRLWIYRNTGLIGYSEFKEGIPGQYRNFFVPEFVSGIFFTNGQLFYTTSSNQLYEISTSLQEQRPLVNLPLPVRDIIKYDNYYLIASNTKGYMVYDAAFRPSALPLSYSTNADLQTMQIKSLVTGSDKIIWLATDGNGIVKVAPYKRYFELVKPDHTLFTTAVRAFCEVENELWVGTKGNGIITMPYVKGQLEHTRKHSFKGDLIGNSSVYAIVKGRAENVIYIGSDGLGITIYDLEDKKFIQWKDIAGTEDLPLLEFTYAIYEDEDGSLWLGSNGYGMAHVRIEKSREGRWSLTYFKHYLSDGTENGPSGNSVFAIVPGSNNQLWIACRDGGGLNVFDKSAGTFRNFKAFNYSGGISHNDVLSLYRDKQGVLWIGTSYGLNYIEESALSDNEPVFTRFTTAEGLPSNTIHAIIADSNNDIWVSTNNGLARINKEDQSIVRFKETDGLQGNEFSDGSVFRNSNGEVFFGGIFGFNYFIPENIHYTAERPKLLITGLKPGMQTGAENSLQILNAGEHDEESMRFTLSRSENFLSLYVKAISYTKSDKCIYAYYLNGYDKEWNTLSAEGKIEYGNLPPGEYTLQLRWSDGESGWLPVTDVFQLTVKQYAWLTWPAFAAYFLMGGVLIYIVGKYRRNKMEMRHKLDMEHLLRRKEDEMHQEKLNFFTNIAHELQTPLTLISAASEQTLEGSASQLNKETGDHYLSLIHSQSARLTYLLQQLMEFSKSDSIHHTTSYSALNISNYLQNLFDLFAPLGERKRLMMTADIIPDLQVYTDKDKLEKIVFNLLSNAFKHTPRGEEVRLLLQLSEDDKYFVLEISNTGCTLSNTEMNRIFDRFFTADAARNNASNTGIGLSFARQLTTLLGGAIEARLEGDRIIFKVSLPAQRVIGQNEEIGENGTQAEWPSTLVRAILADRNTGAFNMSITEHNKIALIESLNSKKKSILVVEDEDAIRRLLKDVLSERYNVFEAGTGTDAIWMMQKVQPDLVISDVLMPDMDGLTLCAKVKNTPETCHIPFIILSARGTNEQQYEGYEAGADAYIPKPFNTAHVLLRVRKLLEYRQQLLEVFQQKDFVKSDAIPEGSDREFITHVVSIVDEHLSDTEFTPAELEKKLQMSKMTLYRRIKSLTNMSPGEFIRQHRIRKAASLLQQTDYSVSEIFYQTGFNNQSYFFREFRKLYQCSPNEYRAKQRIN